ncbi:MAG TPA: hypothetical protein VEQ85_05705 [Lacipirellulaceae bacterium]|nr:hypothetical protein [Lacipirellulaceae bacterium]
MVRSTQEPIVVARISFESTRLSPQCLAETYGRIVPITRKVIRAGTKAALGTIAPPAAKGRTEHG